MAGTAPLVYPGNMLRDPLSGLRVPKDILANLEWRRRLLVRAESDEAFLRILLAAMRTSVVLFVNLICWTRTFFDYPPPHHSRKPAKVQDRPFVTWPAQDRELIRLQRAWQNGTHIYGVKSRELGWTWLNCSFDLWLLTLHANQRVIVASEKADLVDKSHDPNTIFGKYDLNLQPLKPGSVGAPSWLLPRPIERTERLIINPTTGSTIRGIPTTPDMGRSDRAQRAWFDEGASIDCLDAGIQAMRGAVSSIAFISTPKAGTRFNALAGEPWLERADMGWEECPQRGRGRHWITDERGHKRLTGPYREHEIAMSPNPRYVAEELDRVLLGVGVSAIDPQVVADHRKRHEAEPQHAGELVIAPDADGNLHSIPNQMAVADESLKARRCLFRRSKTNSPGWPVFRFQREGATPLCKLWLKLLPDLAWGGIRPPQDDFYVFAADIGEGLSRASSAFSVASLSQRRKVAEFSWAEYEPHDLARLMVAYALWFGGTAPALIGWERNGPGEAVARHMRRLGWTNLYRRKIEDREYKDETDSVGWYSTAATKRILFSQYGDALASDRIINPSARGLAEIGQFVVAAGGRITQSSRTDLDAAADAAHGDVAIADALLSAMLEDAPQYVEARDDRSVTAPGLPDPIRARMRAYEEMDAMAALMAPPDWR